MWYPMISHAQPLTAERASEVDTEAAPEPSPLPLTRACRSQGVIAVLVHPHRAARAVESANGHH